MKVIEVKMKFNVGDFPETRLTTNNVIRKIERLQEELIDDFDETIPLFEIFDENGNKLELNLPIQSI